MKINKSIQVIFLCSTLLLLLNKSNAQTASFVSVKGHRFFVANKPLYYIGTNYWYGGLLGLEIKKEKGVERLRLELDFLKSKGVTNLRILAGAEGFGLVGGVERVGPPVQTGKAVFDEGFLRGLDLLVTEMAKRSMRAVIFLSNNWEWSGGFLQYLNWNGRMEDSVFRRKLTWDETRDYVSEFYSCGPCKADYLKQVAHILDHTNSISKKKYTDDPAIMSWEIANEPRPMRPSAIPGYKNWISDVAAFIKSKDRKHLVTIGTEGDIGTENIAVYEAIHADKHIDYLTIHIWPKNWNWFTGTDIAAGMDSVLDKTNRYISRHLLVAVKLNKPLVIEEFGLPRDGHSYDLTSTTAFRDKYYKSIFTTLQKSKDDNGFVAGVNFWSYGGIVKPSRALWRKGDDYIGDPPMEEQGLNAVFNGDKSTWNLIEFFSSKL